MSRRAFISSVVLVCLSRPVGAAAQAGECYDAEHGPWQPMPAEAPVESAAPPDDSKTGIFSFPPRVRLDPDGTIAVPEGALPTRHTRLRWSIEGPVLQVHLSFRRLAGLRGELGAFGNGWAGQVVATSHLPGFQRHRRTLRLVSVNCASPPPVPASADVPLPLEVSLNSGETFAVGATTDRPGRRMPLEGGQALGLYRGATELVIRVEGGRVAALELHYAPGGVQAVLERLAERFGPREGAVKFWVNRSGGILGNAKTHTIHIR